MIKNEKLQNKIIHLHQMSFKKYDKSNKDYFFFENGKKSFFNNINKANIVLSLLHTLRNRSYHWENILKTTQRNNKTFPRITTIIQGTHIGLNPSKIETFLDDLIKIFDERLLAYC
ncbi:hypothetical protein CHLV4142_10325 [Campylobacter helveticus]|uniref:CAAX protease n=2 Tax=Campylobacter helveticus TaxID=28898 RepID=A0ABY3L3A9_9BACT|nr:hypothetical protein [Campylobacter helveticus]MCR2040535.1 hypothetical protein [Campylobacter helveticus]MCR2055779.1 hypothetical protein [Campylobacter helveticus]MCR2061185.1 hypothetical protein [Campylobacter helveticus]MCR2067287.1 hypothetical protein [Campylobacter helveticus]TNB54622.1 hypothetical protein FDW44_10045 [Campylobacter helveticus]